MIVGRAKHYTIAADGTKTPDPVFVTNREKVYVIIAKMTSDHSCWTYIKAAQKIRDGRMAYVGLYLHFLGPNNEDNMATMVEENKNQQFITVNKNVVGILKSTSIYTSPSIRSWKV